MSADRLNQAQSSQVGFTQKLEGLEVGLDFGQFAGQLRSGFPNLSPVGHLNFGDWMLVDNWPKPLGL
jgi:hypothetical protein